MTAAAAGRKLRPFIESLGMAVEKRSLPKFEIEQHPDLAVAVTQPGTVPMQQFLDVRRIEVTTRLRARTQKHIADKPALVFFDPIFEGYGKPHLRAMNDLLR